MFHVEFLGLPGVGKTTLKNDLVNRLKKKSSNVNDMNDALVLSIKESKSDRLSSRLFKVLPKFLSTSLAPLVFDRSPLKFDAQNRFLAENSLSFQSFFCSESFMERPFNERVMVLSWFLGPSSKYQLIKESVASDQIVFFDEGFLQRAISLFLPVSSSKDTSVKDQLSLYLDHSPLPDLIILVSSSREVCFNRMKSRKKGLPKRLANCDTERLETFYNKGQNLINELVSGIERKGCRVISVINDGRVEDASNELLECFESLDFTAL